MFRYSTVQKGAAATKESRAASGFSIATVRGDAVAPSLHVARSLDEWKLFTERSGVLSEAQILCELFFVLQGGQSEHFQLNDDNQYAVDPSCQISKGFLLIVKDALLAAEDCRFVSQYVAARQRTETLGHIHESFVSWLQDLLKKHYGEVATFETMFSKNTEDNGRASFIQPQGLGLRRLKSLLSCPKAKLNLAKTLILDFQGKSGGELVRLCTEYIHTGDMLIAPLVRSLVERVTHCTMAHSPWIFVSRSWLRPCFDLTNGYFLGSCSGTRRTSSSLSRLLWTPWEMKPRGIKDFRFLTQISPSSSQGTSRKR
jgi:hypothetical protein